MKRKTRYFYYYNELTDDFAGNNIKTKALPEGYEYLPKSRVFRFFRPGVYHFVRAICLLCEKLGIAMRVRGKKALRKREDRSRGCFIYANHTSAFSDAVTGATACGAKLPELAIGAGFYCPNCGRQNADDAKFCVGCGRQLNH